MMSPETYLVGLFVTFFLLLISWALLPSNKYDHEDRGVAILVAFIFSLAWPIVIALFAVWFIIAIILTFLDIIIIVVALALAYHFLTLYI